MDQAFIKGLGEVAVSNGVYGISVLIGLSALVILFCAYKSKSWHFFWERIWFLVAGRSNFKDENLNNIWSEVLDIEMFKFKTGFNVVSKKEIDNVLLWAKNNVVSLNEFIKVSVFFVPSESNFFQRNYRRRAIFYVVLVVICFAFMNVPKMYPRMVEQARLGVVSTGTGFWFDGEKAYIKDWVIGSDQCQKNENPIASDEDKSTDFNVICRLITSDEREIYKNALKMQKNTVTGLLVILMILIIWFSYVSNKYLNAYLFFKKIAQQEKLKDGRDTHQAEV